MFRLTIYNIQIMSKKTVTFIASENSHQPVSTLPNVIRFKNMSNHMETNEILALRLRIEELQSKVTELEAKIKTKRKRIRRKSCDVDKRHKCEYCKKLYGSLVSLNLHLRIKHKKEKMERDRAREAGRDMESEPSAV